MDFKNLEAIGGAIVGVLAFLIYPFRDSILTWSKEMISRLTTKQKVENPFGPVHAEKEKRIDNICVELRYKTDADRSYIFKFHNGEYFSPSDPLWKLTCTNEGVRTGYAYTYNSCRAILVSSVIDWLSPLFGATNLSGTQMVDKATCACPNKCVDTRHIVYYGVRSMDESSSKAFLIERGAHFIIMAPLMRDRHVIGFVGIDYCTEVNQLDLLHHAEEVCQSAHLLSFLVNSEKKS